MLEKFIYTKKKKAFIKELEANNVPEDAIAFIEDTKEIWNRGVYYGPNSVDLSNYTTYEDLSYKQDKISDLATIRANASTYKGTITEVQANGTSISTTGVANIPSATTSKYGVTKLSSSTSSTSTTLAATASAVKAAYDLANKKQDKLTSGTNIKTINGQSILGSGDLSIDGSSSYPVNDFGEVNNSSITLEPNVYNKVYAINNLEINFASSIPGVINEFVVEINIGNSSVSLTLNDNITWLNNEAPNVFTNGNTIIISIVDSFGVWGEFVSYEPV